MIRPVFAGMAATRLLVAVMRRLVCGFVPVIALATAGLLPPKKRVMTLILRAVGETETALTASGVWTMAVATRLHANVTQRLGLGSVRKTVCTPARHPPARGQTPRAVGPMMIAREVRSVSTMVIVTHRAAGVMKTVTYGCVPATAWGPVDRPKRSLFAPLKKPIVGHSA